MVGVRLGHFLRHHVSRLCGNRVFGKRWIVGRQVSVESPHDAGNSRSLLFVNEGIAVPVLNELVNLLANLFVRVWAFEFLL